MPWRRFAPSTTFPVSWRWRRRWRAASGPATAAPSESTAYGSGCASRVRCLPRTGCWSVAELRTTLCGIDIAVPLVNGSATLDAITAGHLGLGAFVTKTVTLHPREGNPPQRIAETPAGGGNSIGPAHPRPHGLCEQ